MLANISTTAFYLPVHLKTLLIKILLHVLHPLRRTGQGQNYITWLCTFCAHGNDDDDDDHHHHHQGKMR